MPSLVPSEGEAEKSDAMRTRAASVEGVGSEDSSEAKGESRQPRRESSRNVPEPAKQDQGDETAEVNRRDTATAVGVPDQHGAAQGHVSATASATADGHGHENDHRNDLDTIGKSPGEIAFFKLLHAEFKKATHFFDRAQQEYVIREERVRKGMEIMKQPNSIMVGEKWSLLAKSIYRLYKDLLLLETFAIMTYCGFSKILKKHDKVTGYHTRNAFMANIVNKANFTNYPTVLEMISRCEQLYEEVSNQLVQDGKQGLYEDERLFINMIHRLNEQVMENVDEGAPNRPSEPRKKSVGMPSVSSSSKESWATSSLRQLVDEIDASRLGGQVSESNECNANDHGSDSDAEEENVKQEATTSSMAGARKRRAVKPPENAGIGIKRKK